MADEGDTAPGDEVRRRSTYTPPAAPPAQQAAFPPAAPMTSAAGSGAASAVQASTDATPSAPATGGESTLEAIERLQAVIAQRQASSGWSWTQPSAPAQPTVGPDFSAWAPPVSGTATTDAPPAPTAPVPAETAPAETAPVDAGSAVGAPAAGGLFAPEPAAADVLPDDVPPSGGLPGTHSASTDFASTDLAGPDLAGTSSPTSDAAADSVPSAPEFVLPPLSDEPMTDYRHLFEPPAQSAPNADVASPNGAAGDDPASDRAALESATLNQPPLADETLDDPFRVPGDVARESADEAVSTAESAGESAAAFAWPPPEPAAYPWEAPSAPAEARTPDEPPSELAPADASAHADTSAHADMPTEAVPAAELSPSAAELSPNDAELSSDADASGSAPAWPWLAASTPPPPATVVEPPPVTGALPWQVAAPDAATTDASDAPLAAPEATSEAMPVPAAAPLPTVEAPAADASDPVWLNAPPPLVEPDAPSAAPTDPTWLSTAGVVPVAGTAPARDDPPPAPADQLPDDLPPTELAAGAGFAGAAFAGPTIVGTAPTVAAPTADADSANVWLPEDVAVPSAYTGETSVVWPPPPLEQHEIPEPKDGMTELFEELPDAQKPAPGMFSLETAGAEPTPLEQRLGRSTRLFWLWFPVAASVLSVGLGAVLFVLGMSFRQTVFAVLIGVALSALPIALTTLAGKWSGQPTLVVSRATFGLVGNALPSLVGLVSRVFWAAVMLWVLASAVTQTVLASGASALTEQQLTLISLGGALVVAVGIAVLGHHLLRRLQVAFGIVALIATVGMIVLTWPSIDLTTALAVPDGSWLTVVSGAAIVFAVLGVTIGHAGSDLARYQRPSSSGAAGMTFASLATVLPALVLFSYGGLLAASDPTLAVELAVDPLGSIAAALPAGFGIPLLVAVCVNLVSGVVVAVYSAGFTVIAIGFRMHRAIATLVAALLLLGVLAALVLGQVDFTLLVVGIALPIAVPMAAWSGIFVGDMMIRTRRFDAKGLLELGGSYAAVRWTNLLWWLALSVAGLGLLDSPVPGLEWTGFLVPLVEPVLPAELLALTTSGGVIFAVVLLGWIWPFVTGIPAVRSQEQNRRLTAGAEVTSA